MQLMYEKNFVSRTEEGRYHIYKAVLEETETKGSLLDRFIDNTYRGSASTLVLQALGNQEVSKDELNEIKKLIQSLENK